MRLLLIFVGLIINFSVVYGQIKTDKDPELQLTFRYTEGVKQANFGNAAEAEKLFKSVIAEDSLYSPAHFHLAKLYYETGRVGDAVPYIEKAIVVDSNNMDYLKQYGSIMFSTKQWDKALEHYKKMMTVDPSDPDNFRLTAAIYMEKNQPYNVFAVLDSAQNRFGVMEQISIIRSDMLRSMGLYDKALANTEELILVHPDSHDGYVALAQIYAAKGIDSMVDRSYDRAVLIDSSNVDVYLNMMDYYKNKGNDNRYLWALQRVYESENVPLEGKLRYFEQFVQNPDFYRKNYYAIDRLVNVLAIKHINDTKVNDFYASHLIRSGRLDEALNIYKAAIHAPQKRFEVFKNVIDIEAYKNNPDSVTYYVSEALKYFPDEPDLYVTLGTSYWQMKEFTKAQKSLDKAIKIAKTDSLISAIYGYKGDMYYEAGDQKKTYRNYDKALTYNPDNVMVLNNYSYYMSEEGRELERALKMSKRVMELEPSNATYIDTYAWILYKLGLYKEAQTYMRQALVFDGNKSSELLLHYGDILAALGDDFMAKIYWQKALDAGADAAEIEKRTGGKK